MKLYNIDKDVPPTTKTFPPMFPPVNNLGIRVDLNAHYSVIVVATTDFQSISSNRYNFSEFLKILD